MRNWTQDYEFEKKLEKNYLDGSAFANSYKLNTLLQLYSTWNFDNTISRLILTYNLCATEQKLFYS